MGLKFFEFFRKNGRATTKEITCSELEEAAIEYSARNLSFWVCVNMIANAVGRCEFRTFRGGEEVFDREYYMWNYEPNVNQNSTAFIHKLVSQLCQENEALIIAPRRKDGFESVVVADGWGDPDNRPIKQNRYKGVVAGGVAYDRAFLESDVLHLQLHHKNIRGAINAMYQSYYRLSPPLWRTTNEETLPTGKSTYPRWLRAGIPGRKNSRKCWSLKLSRFWKAEALFCRNLMGISTRMWAGKSKVGKLEKFNP